MKQPEWNVHKMLARIKSLETRCMLLEEAMEKVNPRFVEPDFPDPHTLSNKELDEAIEQARGLTRDKHQGVVQAGIDQLNELLQVQLNRGMA